MQSITQYKSGNIAVQLQGLNTPVMLTLLPGQRAVDYRVDLHVPGLGPLAFPIQSGLPGVESPVLLGVLSGIPPAGSKTLLATPQGYADVWLLGGRLFVRLAPLFYRRPGYPPCRAQMAPMLINYL